MAEHPVSAIRRKKDSSMVVGMKMVHEGTADAFVTAGNSGAVLVGGQIIVGRLKGVERPPFATVLPTEKGISLLLDCGANVDARPSHLVQFARMGSIYMEHVLGVHEPKVGIVNIGAEEEKGNALVKETFPLPYRIHLIRTRSLRQTINCPCHRQIYFPLMDRILSLSQTEICPEIIIIESKKQRAIKI